MIEVHFFKILVGLFTNRSFSKILTRLFNIKALFDHNDLFWYQGIFMRSDPLFSIKSKLFDQGRGNFFKIGTFFTITVIFFIAIFQDHRSLLRSVGLTFKKDKGTPPLKKKPRPPTPIKLHNPSVTEV